MIILVGVGHVFDISRQVQQIILDEMPVAVALELDGNRLQALLARDRGEEPPRRGGALARFQERIARDFGVEAGDEMLAGYKAAAEINARLMLIDMDINRVLMRINREMTFRERLKMLGSLLAAPFIRRKTVEREMERYAAEGESYLEEVGKAFPTIKRVLLDDRNRHMARNLEKIEKEYDRVLALVGDGHVPGIARLLEGHEVRMIRLSRVRTWETRQPENGMGISYSFNAVP